MPEKLIDKALRLQRSGTTGAGSRGPAQASEATGAPAAGAAPRGAPGALAALAGPAGAAAPQGAPGTLAEPCASCGEKCCNRFAVPITGFDMVRIMRELDCGPQEFAWLDEAQYIQSSPHSAVFIFDEHGQMGERLLILRRHKTNYCIFSRHSSGCAIWGFHPMACKAYPFAFAGKEADGRDKIGYTRNFVCPRRWGKDEYGEGKVREVLEAMETEMAEHNKMVREWNATRARKGGGEAEFFRFLVAKCEKKMAFWERKGAPDAQGLGSLGPKRGYMNK